MRKAATHIALTAILAGTAFMAACQTRPQALTPAEVEGYGRTFNMLACVNSGTVDAREAGLATASAAYDRYMAETVIPACEEQSGYTLALARATEAELLRKYGDHLDEIIRNSLPLFPPDLRPY